MVPCSPWPKDKRLKEIGLYQLQNLLEGIRPMAWKMFKLAGFTEQEIEDMVSAAKDYLRDIRNQPTAYM